MVAVKRELLDALELLLDADIRSGKPVLSKPGMLNRRHYYRRAGMKSTRSAAYAGGVFERYERLLPDGSLTDWELVRRELCERLETNVIRDFRSDKLVRDRNGRISRSHYAEAIGVNRVITSRFLKDTFVKLDALVGRLWRSNIRPRPAKAASRLSHVSGNSDALAAEPSATPATNVIRSHTPGTGAVASDMHPSSLVNEGESSTARTSSARPDEDGRTGEKKKRGTSRGDRDLPAKITLRGLLEADLNAGTIQRVFGGKISRQHYSPLAGVPVSMAKIALGDVFEEFDAHLGKPIRVHDHRLPEMRRYLEEEWEAGRLGVRNGCIDRSGFLRHFGFKGGDIFGRYPAVREMFEEFDKRVGQTGYMPAAVRSKLAELAMVLANDPPLNVTGLAIDRTNVGARIGVSFLHLAAEPFAKTLAEADREHLDRLKSNGSVVLMHGRLFDFRELIELWPEHLVIGVASRFRQVESGQNKGHAIKACHATIRLFRDVGVYWAERSGSKPFIPRELNAEEWDAGARAMAAAIRAAPSLQISTKGVLVGDINKSAAVYSRVGLIPHVPKVRSVKHAQRLGGRRPGLAEAGTVKDPPDRADPVQEYVSFAAQTLREVAARQSLDIDEEVDMFAASIGREIARDPTAAALSIPQACLRIINRRLDVLGRIANEIVDEARSMMERGSELLAASAFDAAAFTASLLEVSNPNHRTKLMRSFFPKPEDNPIQAIGNLLAFAEQVSGGRMPTVRPGVSRGSLQGFLTKRYHEHGGRRFLDAHLNPSAKTVSAVLLLCLLASGSNIAVGRTEHEDCFSESALKGYVSLTGSKARADGKPIIVDLEEGSDAVQAMSWLLTATERRRARAFGNSRESLFIVDGPFDVVQEITETTFRAHFKLMASLDPEMSELLTNPSMIRPSILLKTAIENDGRIQIGVIVGQHGEEVSKRYQQRSPVLLMYDERIRQMHGKLEVLALQPLPDPHLVLGITAQEWELRSGELRRTGLGVFCKGVVGKKMTVGGACGSLDCWNECPSMLLVANVEAIADLQIWQASLRSAQGKWVRDHVERWAQKWLPWLRFCDVVEEKLSRGPGLLVWDKAKVLRKQIEGGAFFVPPTLW